MMKVPNSLRFTGKDPSIKGAEKSKILNEIMRRLSYQIERNSNSKQEFFGKTPSVFIGSYNYPRVSAGFLSVENYENNDSPIIWSKSDPAKYSITEIIRLRSNLINSRFGMDVKTFKGSFSDKLKEISLSIKPVDAEVALEKKPYFSLSLDADTLPHGPSVPVKRFLVTENPDVPLSVEKAVSDIDLKAGSAINELFKKGLDEHYLTKILSTGSLGVKEERKMVPTKWAITAVDDTLGKKISLSDSRDFSEHEHAAFYGGYMGNYYLALIFPGPWSYELFETYVGDRLSSPLEYKSASDYEGVYGRKSYASNTVGGYYAARLAVLEYMKKKQKTGRILLLRFITSEYWAPLGVWVVREASRKAMETAPKFFQSRQDMLIFAAKLIHLKFNLDLKKIYKESRLLKELGEQMRLTAF